MTETLTGTHEKLPDRIPTYDSFNDPDEALAWVLERVHAGRTDDEVRAWWTEPHLGGESPEIVWYSDPNLIIRMVH
jgi:hypothetical protein